MIELKNRYLFTGRLIMQTALHIGGGRVTLSNSDSPIVLTPEEKPFIPGSSFKGALRSTVEKLVPLLPEKRGLRSCGLPTLKDEKNQCPTAKQSKEITDAERENDLCHTCRLFGSPYAASRINVGDLYLAKDAKGEEEWGGIVQVRDGVAIDRDSESAKPRLKYDFEVVPATTVFDLSIALENATRDDLQLISVGLSEYVHGFGMIGGKRSRGLGGCLLEDLQVFELDLVGINGEPISETERNSRLREYLLDRKFPTVTPGSKFLETWIKTIFA